VPGTQEGLVVCGLLASQDNSDVTSICPGHTVYRTLCSCIAWVNVQNYHQWQNCH
jgi:hypothetical protein